jgi:AbiU2
MYQTKYQHDALAALRSSYTGKNKPARKNLNHVMAFIDSSCQNRLFVSICRLFDHDYRDDKVVSFQSLLNSLNIECKKRADYAQQPKAHDFRKIKIETARKNQGELDRSDEYHPQCQSLYEVLGEARVRQLVADLSQVLTKHEPMIKKIKHLRNKQLSHSDEKLFACQSLYEGLDKKKVRQLVVDFLDYIENLCVKVGVDVIANFKFPVAQMTTLMQYIEDGDDRIRKSFSALSKPES